MKTERHMGGVITISGKKEEVEAEVKKIISGFKKTLKEKFKPDEFERIEAFLDRGFAPNAIMAIASIFLYAKEHKKSVEEVLAECEKEWKRNWDYQHPEIKGDPSAPGGAGQQNRSSITHIYRTLGIPLPEEAKKVEIPDGEFVVKTENSTYRFGKREKGGIRSVSRDEKSLSHKRCKITRLVLGEDMELVWADDPENGWGTTAVRSIEPA